MDRIAVALHADVWQMLCTDANDECTL